MLDLGPHASFIIAAYGVTVIVVGALVFATLEDDRKQRRMLAALERQGIKRRSAAKPATPKLTSKAAKPRTSKPARTAKSKTSSKTSSKASSKASSKPPTAAAKRKTTRRKTPS